ncbi:MAG TPA: thioredoxin family protein [Flavobacteriales bacterium]
MMMKTLALAACVGFAFAPHELPDMAIGASAPATDVKMKDVSGKELDLKSANGKNGLLVVFSCNTCPFVIGGEGSQGWEGRYPALAELAAKNGIGFTMINSNTTKRDGGDGFADMQARYKEKGLKGYYLLDDNNKVADAFGARTTPHVFLFNKDLKLVYKGAIDDNVEDPKAVKAHYVNDAIAALAAGKPIDPATTRNIGCSIKRAHVH